MEIQYFGLTNLGRFKSLEVNLSKTEFAKNKVVVFIGNNGAGKTSILKSIATSLSWFVARLRAEKGSGSPLSEAIILNGQPSAVIDLKIIDENSLFSPTVSGFSTASYNWKLAKTAKGKKAIAHSQLNDANRLADHYRNLLAQNENASLPLIAFYPVERVVLDVPLKIKNKHDFRQLDGYDNSLNQGVDFRRFFEWFREREDVENESGVSIELIDKLKNTVGDNQKALDELNILSTSNKDSQLKAVKTAIANFMPGFKNLRVRRKPRLHMTIDKDGQTLDVLQLSQGEKSLMALVGDIARRLAMMNPALDNPLEGSGIVLIDEVDMHLHPNWQRSLVKRLTSTFTNCQFILTTHSPLVISDHQNILVFSLDNGELFEVPSQYGEDVNSVLSNVMETEIRNASVSIKLNDLFDLIQDAKTKENFSKAQIALSSLENDLSSNNLELIKAKMFLRKKELKYAQNK